MAKQTAFLSTYLGQGVNMLRLEGDIEQVAWTVGAGC